MEHPTAHTLDELRAINNDEGCLGALDVVRVQLNDGTSLAGSVRMILPDGFQLQTGSPVEPSLGTPVYTWLVPQIRSDGSKPQTLHFGQGPKDVEYLVGNNFALETTRQAFPC